jgi:hypothetical protein
MPPAVAVEVDREAASAASAHLTEGSHHPTIVAEKRPRASSGRTQWTREGTSGDPNRVVRGGILAGYSITASARATKVGGISSPAAFAVLR